MKSNKEIVLEMIEVTYNARQYERDVDYYSAGCVFHGAPYVGKTPRVVRIFGRQRLLSLMRALPHVKTAKVLTGEKLYSHSWLED